MLGHVIDQTLQDCFVFLHAFLCFCVSQWLPLLAPTHAVPSCVSSWGSRSFVQPRCQLTKCEGQPSLRESTEQPSLWAGSWDYSTVSALYGSRPPFLGLLPLPSGIYSCAWSKSLQAFVVMPVHYARTPLHLSACYGFRCSVKVPLGVQQFACLNMPVGDGFLCPIRKRI